MGITSISQLPRVYSQNHKQEKTYYDSIDNGLIPIARGYSMNEDDIIRRKVVMNLMCHFVLEFQSIEDEFGIDFNKYFAWGLENLKEFAGDGLVTMDDNKIVVTEIGRLMIRTIAMNFDGYIERQVDKTKYSRTV